MMMYYKFKRQNKSQTKVMSITPRIKSIKHRNNLVVNVSIEIPLKQKCPISYRSQQSSISPSPSKHKKKFKLIITPNYDKKTMNTSNLNTLRDLPVPPIEHPPSRKKSIKPIETNISSHQIKSTIQKFKSCELSPRKKHQTSRKGKQGNKIVRNISILDQVINDEDNIIKYTSNSNEIRDKYEDLLMNRSSVQKVETNISEVDIFEIRRIQNYSKNNREKQKINKINDLLKNSCAKKIQRAWRNYKTKKLIKCYSNDIRSKYLKNIKSPDEPLLSTRSLGFGLKMKKKLFSQPQIQKTEREGQFQLKTARNANQVAKTDKIVKKIQEDNMQKWQNFLSQIKNKKNLSQALQFSLQRSEQLKKQLKKQFFSSEESNQKIIKTKKYYEEERQKWRQTLQKSNGTLKRQERIHYFQNEMLKLQNDYIDNSDKKNTSISHQNVKELQELENQKLRKKLELFKNHLPNIQEFSIQMQKPAEQKRNMQKQIKTEMRNRIQIGDLVKKKSQLIENKMDKQVSFAMQKLLKHQEINQSQDNDSIIHYDEIQEEELFLEYKQSSSPLQMDLYNPTIPEDNTLKQKYRRQAQKSLIRKDKQLKKALETTLTETPHPAKLALNIEQKQNNEWKFRLKSTLKQTQKEILHIILDELILESLIEISQSEKLIIFIKGIYDKKNVKKPEGIVTNQSSIKDYLNYFVNFLYENKLQQKIMANLMKPIGPTASDVLKYFRGEDIVYDPDSEYVMNIKIFNLHWEYANQLIYFDPKWQEPKKQTQRVSYLKQLTKIFFRIIFDGFNQSLEPHRIYGAKGKPYPWSCFKINFEAPALKKVMALAYERVMKYSITYAGVLFGDKHHNLTKGQIDQIQEQNMARMLTLQLKEDEYLWNFFEDELVELKLEIAKFLQDRIFHQIITDIKTLMKKR